MRKYFDADRKTVITLRMTGLSLGQIQRKTNIPKTTVRKWTAHITLSEELKKNIRAMHAKILQQGRVIYQKERAEMRKEKEQVLLKKGIDAIGELTEKEKFVAGIALYWAEGFKNKHERRLGFCNSDPNMIRFYLCWLEEILKIDKKDIIARVTINKAHQDRIKDIEQYWSEITGIPTSQFSKPFFQNTSWKKEYTNNNYFGVLRIHAQQSLEELLQMRGWIQGLYKNLPG